MARFRCPECAIEAEIAARYGGEVVSAYCLKHIEGADGHTRVVRMTAMPVAQATWAHPRRTPEMEAVSAVPALAAAGRSIR